nr:MAG TPA: capsid protein [Caudoviricetes sp.]DAH93873.1 MAG TPA: capsid protein [Caudoviricetes sp.]
MDNQFLSAMRQFNDYLRRRVGISRKKNIKYIV